ncbi:MAG: sulfatase-like hydrolase/transferase [Candidatus Sumerlaeota bacterium]|nr:sulfatase-like hydrolase/transferase [Candidatus Sumerlaeota bacterium]
MTDGITRREFLGQALGAGAAIAGGRSLAASAEEADGEARPSRPNLVYVFSDQQSYDMLGCYGNRQIITPHIDSFAAQAVRFTHCVSNAPLCTPYRGILLTGQHPLYCGALVNDLQVIAGNGPYFGEVLRDAGYRMGYFGKWHVYGGNRNRPIPPGPYRYGFDQTFLSNNCTLLFDEKRAYYWDAEGKKQLYGDWEPYAQTRQAMEFVDANADKPFALFLSWHPPHNWGGDNYAAPADVASLYDPDRLSLRPNCADTPRTRTNYAGHMAMCTSLDKAFQWLMSKLEEKGLADNTIVVYTADHGDMLMSHDWPSHKGKPEEESCRVPFILRWPRRLKPRASDLLIGALDLMPTLLGLMGLKVPDTCQGVNLADAVLSERDDAVESVPLFFFSGDWRGVYTKRHTYAFDLPGGRASLAGKTGKPKPYACLYDRETDPREMRNLYAAAEHRALRDQLHDQATAWMTRFHDTGVPFREVMQRVVIPDDQGTNQTAKSLEKGTGRLRGRPVDLL